ncbi:MAG: phytoene/squalene synthase family protein [Pseudomonadota bacterium]
MQMTSKDLSACRQALKHGSRSFRLASLFLPQPFRDAATSLYAFCRQADDGVDESSDPLAALAQFGQRVDNIYQNKPSDNSADRALHQVVNQFSIPRELLDALLEGFAWDCQGRQYEDFAELKAYAARVAGTVGVMMALLMGVRRPEALARAADLGVAMQLSNIARDVGEDARRGRLYLPKNWLTEAGINGQTFLERPAFNSALAEVIRRLLAEADTLYQRADAGIHTLPSRCRTCIYSARLLYSEIGNEVVRRQFDSVSQRAVVGRMQKLRVLSELRRLKRLEVSPLHAPPLAEVAFLVGAVPADVTIPVRSDKQPAVEWVLDLFADLERRDTVRAVPVRARRTVRQRPTRPRRLSHPPAAALPGAAS